MLSPTQTRFNEAVHRHPLQPVTEGGTGNRTSNEIQIHRETPIDELMNNDLGIGSRGAEVAQLQQELEDAGYDTGGVDGAYGPNTQAAVRDFQQDEIDAMRQELQAGGLSIRAAEHKHEQIVALQNELDRGVVGDVTQIQLNESSVNPNLELQIGSRGKQVAEAQQALEDNGIETGGVDGIYGPLTDAAVREFQQEQIDIIEFRARGFVPLNEEQNAVFNNLRDEFERGVAGPQTLAMLDPNYEFPPNDSFEQPIIPEIPLPDIAVEESPFENAELDVPGFDGIDGAAEALVDGRFSDALEASLNSEGDSVTLDLGVNANLPLLVPGTTVGIAPSLGAEIEKVEDGYEVSIEASVAAELGLALNSDDIDGVGFAELGGRVTYQYDTQEEAEQAIRDLALTAGNHPALDVASDLADKGLDVADFLLNNPFTNTVGRFLPGGDFILGIERAVLEQAQSSFDSYSRAREDAVDRLNGAYESREISFGAGIEVNAELEGLLPVTVENFGLGVNGRIGSEFTAVFNADGSLSLTAEYKGEGSGAAGLGLGVAGEVATSVSYTQNFVKDSEGGYRTDGSATLSLNGDAQGQVEAGVGVSASRGLGNEFSYSFEVDELNGNLRSVAENFLAGDLDGALNELGDIEGDLEVQGRATGSLEASLGGGYLGAELGVEGELAVDDKGDALEVDDLSLEDAFEFLREEFVDAVAS